MHLWAGREAIIVGGGGGGGGGGSRDGGVGAPGRGAIEEHVRPWCRRHGVDCDQLLLTYVSELCTAIVGTDDLLEGRCLAVLMCIHDPAVRVDAAMALLQVRTGAQRRAARGGVAVQ